MKESTKFSRRTVLIGLSMSGAISLLAACGSSTTVSSSSSTASSTSAVSGSKTASATSAAPAAQTSSVKVQGGSVINYLCRPDIVTAYGAEAAIKNYEQSHPGVKVVLSKPPANVNILTKVRAAIASHSLPWDGWSVMVPPWDTALWVESGVIQPLDALIRTSNEKDASKLLSGMIPTVREAVKYKGKVYAIPGNVGSVALQWYWEPLKGIGLNKQPATWDETMLAASEIKKKYPALIPLAFDVNPLCSLFTLIFAATPPKDLFDSKGLLNIQGPGAISALNWMKKMVDAGLMSPTSQNMVQDWNRKKVAMILSYDVLGEDAQKTYGYSAADTGINIFPKAGEVNSGTPFWTNASVVFNTAKNPQGMTDFFVWWFGPSNAAAQKILVATAAKPCYTYTYESTPIFYPC